MLTEDSFVLWLLEKKKQEILKKDAMIDWLAKSCEELTDLIWYPETQCPKTKSDWIKAAEKAVQANEENVDGL